MTKHSVGSIQKAYARSTTRLFLLDFDGTLIGFQPRPEMVVPTKKIMDVLSRLSNDPNNTVVLVSGRHQPTMQEWFGHLPLGMSAEHGVFRRQPGKKWRATAEVDEAWKVSVRQAMEVAVNAVPESFIEDKVVGLTWHYRLADANLADQWAAKLNQQFKDLPAGVKLQNGSKMVEVKLKVADKGIAAKWWVARQNYDFVMVAGDDTTDEDMFAVVPEGAFIVKVGQGPSMANARIASPVRMVDFLAKLCTS